MSNAMPGTPSAEGSLARGVILVEGLSDKAAIERLATRLGRDLDGEGIAVVPMGGSKNISAFLDRFGPGGLGLELAGLCDAGEEDDFLRGVERAGLGRNLTRAVMEELGFYVCVVDLEDELIRALGSDAVVELIAAQGELEALRTFQKQPAWAGRPIDEQLRRFFGTKGGRKRQYAPLLVEALSLEAVPRPLAGVLAGRRRST